MPKKEPQKTGNKIGAWAFLIGVILAIILGVFSTELTPSIYKIVLVVLILLGIVVGLLNVTTEETSRFLLAGVSLVIVAYIGSSALQIVPLLNSVFNSLLILFIPATIIVALRSVFEVAKD